MPRVQHWAVMRTTDVTDGSCVYSMHGGPGSMGAFHRTTARRMEASAVRSGRLLVTFLLDEKGGGRANLSGRFWQARRFLQRRGQLGECDPPRLTPRKSVWKSDWGRCIELCITYDASAKNRVGLPILRRQSGGAASLVSCAYACLRCCHAQPARNTHCGDFP